MQKSKVWSIKLTNMNTMKFFLVILTLSLFSSASAQTSKELMIQEWERAKAYTKEYLDAMPEKDYGLKPTPDMRSFAGQMLHLSEANYGFAAAASGLKSPFEQGALEKTTDLSKANVSKLVLDGYDFVIAAIKQMTPAQMDEQIKFFGRFDMSKGTAINKAFEHQTHHRGQTTVYIRLAGAKPPQEKLF
jgi:uncharacterized damage-inducible protein DinB